MRSSDQAEEQSARELLRQMCERVDVSELSAADREALRVDSVIREGLSGAEHLAEEFLRDCLPSRTGKPSGDRHRHPHLGLVGPR